MIVDTSALVAVLRDEADAPDLARALITNTGRMSAANYLELGIVVDGFNDPVVGLRLDELLRETGVEVVAVTRDQAEIARRAYRHFGRGSGHPARLNFGDCFAYALSVDTGEPLLWKGDDFGHTGLTSALD